jgi:1-acyl-sn-glycerol-3-phosphate acyltransferase
MSTVGLPRSAAQHPATVWLNRLRPAANRFVRRRWDVHVTGVENVPHTGPVILSANHIGIMDGPFLVALAPRPVHALTKQEMFQGRSAAFLRRSGQIPLDRFHPDRRAVAASLRVLRDGGVLGIFPEGTRGAGEYERFRSGAAYFALVTGAPVVPVTFFGTRPPGGASDALPGRGVRIDIVYGEPWTVVPVDWPRTREHVDRTAALLRQHLRGELRRARALTGRELPGPLPVAESDKTPRAGS